MRRLLAAVVLLLGASFPARAAQPPFRACPYLTIGWSVQYPGPLTSVQYDSSHQIMYVVFGTAASAFSNVPIGVQQAFSTAATEAQAQAIYQGTVLPSYPSLALAEVDNCPLEYENGTYIWTGNQGKVRPGAVPCPALAFGPQVRPGFSPPLYYQNGPGILYLDYGYAISKAYLSVPFSVVQQLQQLQNPQQVFDSLAGTYHTILLSTPDNCPIKTSAGYYLWTH